MNPPLRLVPQAGPAVWTGATLTPSDWMLPIGAEETAALEALAAAPGEGARPASPPRLAALLQALAERLENGRGFVLLRGLPLDRLGAEGAEAVLLALGGLLGTVLPQDTAGSLVRALAGPGRPAAGPLRFQADPADAVALLCLRQLREGGSVTLLSAPSLHNALLRTDRAALALLHEGLPQRPAPGAEAVVALPVFSTASGAFVGRCDHAALATEAMTEAQRRALAALEEAAAAPGQALSIPLHPGDLLLRSPLLVWKVATPAEETPAEESRHLLRLWLAMPNSRALPESFRPVYGETAAGAPRGGIRPGAAAGGENSGPGMVGG